LAEWVSRTLFVGIVILFVYGGFAYYVSKRTFDLEMGDRLLAIARITSGLTKAEWLPFLTGKGDLYEKFRSFLQEKKEESQAKNIFIMDLEGRVLVDAEGRYDFRETNWLRDLDPHPFQRAREGHPSVSILFQENDGGIYKIGYAPILHQGKVTGILAVEASAKFVDGLKEFARVLFSFGLACLLLMGGLLVAFGRRFIAPIKEMARASQRVAEGDFSRRVKVTSGNELGALAHAFNEMTQRLQSHNEYILESMANGLLVLDLGGNITTFNRAASLILGVPQTGAVGRPYGEALAACPELVTAIRSSHEEGRMLEDHEVDLGEGNPRIIRLRSAPLLGAAGQELGTEFLFTDETELRKLQSRIKHSEKLATIGELAAGIAHEIRNPLGAMKGFAEILQRKLSDRSAEKEIVSDIASEIEILNRIVTNFLVFAKPTALEAGEVDLSEAVRGVLPLVAKEAESKGVRIRVEEKDTLSLQLDLEQFRRALLNLALNALQASPRGGEVVLGLGGFTRAKVPDFLRGLGLEETPPLEASGHWAGVWVMDEGPGIAPENLGKLFNPFFTTKTEGFGLGLSITRKILEALGGWVQAANRPGGGAVFLALLPVTHPKKKKEVVR